MAERMYVDLWIDFRLWLWKFTVGCICVRVCRRNFGLGPFWKLD
jgi:hypothetical protein